MRLLLLSLLLSIFLSSCASKKQKVLRNPTISETKEKAVQVLSNSNTNVSNGTVSVSGRDYIERYKDIAIIQMNTYGIPASIKLAQAILESGNGNSFLAKEANNHFGIKCGNAWTGKSLAKDDDNPNDCFRVYSSVEESYNDHSQFLLRKRYEKLFALDKGDYKGWAKGLKDAGYASNPRYPELLINIIERYDLHQYDGQVTIVQNKVEILSVAEQPSTVTVKPIKTSTAGMIIHEVKPSQTLYSISRQYSTTVERLKKLNNLSSENLSIGQLLVISE